MLADSKLKLILFHPDFSDDESEDHDCEEDESDASDKSQTESDEPEDK